MGPSALGVKHFLLPILPKPSHTQDWHSGLCPDLQASRRGLEETRIRHGLGPLKGITHGNTFSTREAGPGSQKFQAMSLQEQGGRQTTCRLARAQGRAGARLEERRAGTQCWVPGTVYSKHRAVENQNPFFQPTVSARSYNHLFENRPSIPTPAERLFFCSALSFLH